jgi:exodeoxyribonuclease VII large subunit
MKVEGDKKIFTVSEVNRKARMALEGGLGELWVEGELSRVTLHGSGHWYFTLKDAEAAVPCAMFSRDNERVRFKPVEGQQVRMLVRPSLFEASGRYQLLAAILEKVGRGDLQAQFEALKAKLAAEGLFDPARKRPLPRLPQRIGVVTSPTGAAIRDMLNVLLRRFPNLEVLLAPVNVQGEGCAKSIAAAIGYFNRADAPPVDLLLVGRGGGSMEDLWGFNEEVVARAIAASKVPVISAVGHEIDFTIADFVADLRAPTPSAAAELAVPVKAELEHQLLQLERRLQQGLVAKEQQLRSRLNRVAHSYVFKEPEALVKQYFFMVTRCRERLVELLKSGSKDERRKVERLEVQLVYLLESGLRQGQQRVDELGMRMQHRIERETSEHRQRLDRLKGQLRILNPLAVLGRGYSLTRLSDGGVVRSVHELRAGDRLITQLSDGQVESAVMKP